MRTFRICRRTPISSCLLQGIPDLPLLDGQFVRQQHLAHTVPGGSQCRGAQEATKNYGQMKSHEAQSSAHTEEETRFLKHTCHTDLHRPNESIRGFGVSDCIQDHVAPCSLEAVKNRYEFYAKVSSTHWTAASSHTHPESRALGQLRQEQGASALTIAEAQQNSDTGSCAGAKSCSHPRP